MDTAKSEGGNVDIKAGVQLKHLRNTKKIDESWAEGVRGRADDNTEQQGDRFHRAVQVMMRIPSSTLR